MTEISNTLPKNPSAELSENDSINTLMQNLSIPKEVIQDASMLTPEEKEELELQLKKIEEEIQVKGYTKNALPTNIQEKIKDILLDCGVKQIENWDTYKLSETIDNKTPEYIKKIQENVTAVKSIDPIVSSELAELKSKSPLPKDVQEKIAEKTGITQAQVAQGGGDKANEMNALIDAYYLSSQTLEENVIKKLKPEKQKDASLKFGELRSSMWDIPQYPVPANKSLSLLPDKSEKTKQTVESIITPLTRDNPNTLITRTGDKLRWNGADKKSYEIDMSTRPLWLTKRSGILEIHQSIPDAKDVEAQAKVKEDLREIQWKNTLMSGKIVSDFQKSKDAIEKNAKGGTLFPSEIQGLMETVGNKDKNTEEKQKACAQLIEIYGQAEIMPEFQAKIDDTEIMSVQSWLKDYFYSAKVWLSVLKKSLDNEMTLNRKVPKKSEEKLVSAEEFEANTEHNLNMLWRLGMGSFRNMDEVSAFLQTQNGVGVGGNWSDKNSINAYLWSEKLEWTQIKKVLGGLAKVHDSIRKDKVSELEDEGKMIVLNRSEWDGQTKLGKSLNTERIKKWGGLLNVSDFRRLLSQNTLPDGKSPQSKKR